MSISASLAYIATNKETHPVDCDLGTAADKKIVGDLKMQIKVIPIANSCGQGLLEFVNVIKKATWETHEQMGSSNPARCSARWEVDFQRDLIIRLARRLPPLLKEHGLDQVRIFNRLTTSCPRQIQLFVTSEKYRLKEATKVWGVQVLAVDSATLRMPENPVFGDDWRKDQKEEKQIVWRPWQ